MYRYKKLMIVLSIDESDAPLIKYAGLVSRMAKSNEICFIHVSKSFDIPEEIKKVYPEISFPVDEAARKQMKESVKKHFNGYDKSILKYEAVEGPELKNLVTYAKDYDADLMIVGHCMNMTASCSFLSERLARRAPCSVLMIPPIVRPKLRRLVVATDFSDNALNALDVGSAFGKAAEIDSIDVINTYRVPEGYYKTGKTHEEFAAVMRKNAEERLEKMTSSVDLQGLKVNPEFRLKNDVVKGIQEFADELDADLVVVGARGRSGEIAAILLGSVTEGLIRNLTRPLIAVKKKGDGLNIIDALYSE